MVSNRSLSALTDLVPVYTSSYKRIAYSAAHKLLYQEWSRESLQLSWEQFMKEATAFIEALTRYLPGLLLINQEDFNFRLTDDHNKWYLQHMAPALQQTRPRKAAVVANEDLLNQLKMEQLAESMQTYFTTFHTEYLFFESNQKALEWLISK